MVKELESERELSHVEIFASGGDVASKLQVQDDSQIVDLVRGHHMFHKSWFFHLLLFFLECLSMKKNSYISIILILIFMYILIFVFFFILFIYIIFNWW